ncbi:MAG: hypothetical protein WBI04_10525 [Trichlorobacter sp.]
MIRIIGFETFLHDCMPFRFAYKAIMIGVRLIEEKIERFFPGHGGCP